MRVIIHVDLGDGIVYVYDTSTGNLYEGIVSESTRVDDEDLKNRVEEFLTHNLKKYVDAASGESAVEGDKLISNSEESVEYYKLVNVLEDYNDYVVMARSYADFMKNTYIPVITKLFRFFDKVVSLLSASSEARAGVKNGGKEYRISNMVSIVVITMDDGVTKCTPVFKCGGRFVPFDWETYDIDVIKECLDDLASHWRRLSSVYSELNEKYGFDVPIDRVVKALRIYRKLEQ